MRQPLITSTTTASAFSQCVMRIHSGCTGRRASDAVWAATVAAVAGVIEVVCVFNMV